MKFEILTEISGIELIARGRSAYSEDARSDEEN